MRKKLVVGVINALSGTDFLTDDVLGKKVLDENNKDLTPFIKLSEFIGTEVIYPKQESVKHVFIKLNADAANSTRYGIGIRTSAMINSQKKELPEIAIVSDASATKSEIYDALVAKINADPSLNCVAEKLTIPITVGKIFVIEFTAAASTAPSAIAVGDTLYQTTSTATGVVLGKRFTLDSAGNLNVDTKQYLLVSAATGTFAVDDPAKTLKKTNTGGTAFSDGSTAMVITSVKNNASTPADIFSEPAAADYCLHIKDDSGYFTSDINRQGVNDYFVKSGFAATDLYTVRFKEGGTSTNPVLYFEQYSEGIGSDLIARATQYDQYKKNVDQGDGVVYSQSLDSSKVYVRALIKHKGRPLTDGQSGVLHNLEVCEEILASGTLANWTTLYNAISDWTAS